MSLVTLALAKVHCRVDAADEDETIQLYVDASEIATSKYLDRNIYADQDALDAVPTDTTGIVINSAIKSAILLSVGNLYANRESVTDKTAIELPLGIKWLLDPFKELTL